MQSRRIFRPSAVRDQQRQRVFHNLDAYRQFFQYLTVGLNEDLL